MPGPRSLGSCRARGPTSYWDCHCRASKPTFGSLPASRIRCCCRLHQPGSARTALAALCRRDGLSLGSEEKFSIERLFVFPYDHHGLEDLALGVQPRVDLVARPF